MHRLTLLVVCAACVDQTGSATITEPTIWLEPSATIDPAKLPLREQHYVTDAPLAGYVYVCDPFMYRQTGAPGAVRDGDWIHGDTFDMTAKLVFAGNVLYPNATFTVTASCDQRAIAGN